MPHAHTLRGNICSQMLGAQASTDCDKVPYPFRKCKTPMLKTLKELDLPGLFGVLENEDVSSSWSSSYQHCTDNLLQYIFSRVRETDAHRRISKSPPHIKHAHMQMLLWPTAGSSRRFRLRIWLEDQRRDNLSQHQDERF